jgi:two-component system heavy metal sensor histidine kinase CusS
LALRLTLLFGLAAAVVFAGFGWVIVRSMEHHFAAEDLTELRVIASAAQRALVAVDGRDHADLLARRLEDILVGHHGASLHIASHDGKALFSSAGPDLSAMSGDPAAWTQRSSVHEWSDGDHTYRVFMQPTPAGAIVSEARYAIIVAVPIDYHLRFLEGFRRTLWLMIASGIAIMALFGWVAVRQGHAPLRRIVRQIHQISASQLHTRLAPDSVPRELRDLALSFNDMLGRMEAAFLRLSNFSADIAHELRTPVTNLMTQTQVALSQARSVEEYREILYSNIEEYERMAQMVGDMLYLAQADDGRIKRHVSDVMLADEARTLFEYYEAWADERSVTLSLEGAATVAGDRMMLRRALGNLLSNAIRHTPPGQTVRLRIATAAEAVTVVVENPGETIAAEHLPRLFDRFYRVDPSRQRSGEGAGLGLAIVKSIVDAHGGTIQVQSVDGCTQFRVNLPKTPRAS